MYVLSVQYSCAVVSVILFGGKTNLVLLTLFYSTLLAFSGKPLQTDRWTDRQRNKFTRFAWAGGTCPRFAWAGGTFFQLCCCVSFWFWRGIGFGLTYLCTQSTIQLWWRVSFLIEVGNSFGVLHILSVQYSCAVVLVFWMQREKVLIIRTYF